MSGSDEKLKFTPLEGVSNPIDLGENQVGVGYRRDEREVVVVTKVGTLVFTPEQAEDFAHAVLDCVAELRKVS